MKDLKKMLEETNGLYCKIDSILKSSTYDDCDDLSGLDIDYRDGEQLFLLEELQAIMRNLDEVRGRLIYLSLPVISNEAYSGEGKMQQWLWGTMGDFSRRLAGVSCGAD